MLFTCVRFAILLFVKNGIKTNLVNGTSKRDFLRHHVWLESDSKVIIDITCAQFNGEKGFSDCIDSIHIGKGNIVHKVFSYNKQIEAPTIFLDKRFYNTFNGKQNPYQRTLLEVYDILNNYIKF